MLYLHIQHWYSSFVIQLYLPPATFSTIVLLPSHNVSKENEFQPMEKSILLLLLQYQTNYYE